MSLSLFDMFDPLILQAIAKEALDVLSKAPLEKTGFMLALDGSGQWLPGVGQALMPGSCAWFMPG